MCLSGNTKEFAEENYLNREAQMANKKWNSKLHEFKYNGMSYF